MPFLLSTTGQDIGIKKYKDNGRDIAHHINSRSLGYLLEGVVRETEWTLGNQ